MPEIQISDTMTMVPITQIKPYHRNPRRNEATVDKLVELIPKVGFNVPLTLDRQNVIIKGHTRWKAAIRLGMKALPCVYSDADEETIKLDRLADNRVQEFSSWDNELLKSELGSINLPFDFNLGDLNFDIGAAPLPDPPILTAPIVDPSDPPAAGNGTDPDPPAAPDPATAAPAVPIDTPEYIEVTCNKCGNHLFVRKE